VTVKSPTSMRTPSPGAVPGTLVLASNEKPRIFVIDYCATHVIEKEVFEIDDVASYLTDSTPSVTWVDVRGIGHQPTFERLGQIFHLHPLALEDVVNVPQRPKSDLYPEQQVVVARMIQMPEDGRVKAEQVALVFGKDFLLTVQEDPDSDVFDPVRDRIRNARGSVRSLGADYLAYALLDAVVDGFFPVLEQLGERLEDLEETVMDGRHTRSRDIHQIKRELLTVRRAIWPQRDVVNVLLREESPFIGKEARVYLRDTYDHTVQVMDMVETFREIASGLMDLYLSSVSNRMNEIMKVLTILSTIFLPITFIAGVYGMNFDTAASPYNMPELKWRYGYPCTLAAMALSVLGLLLYYRRRGWLGGGDRS
jgi:magnesium transporter